MMIEKLDGDEIVAIVAISMIFLTTAGTIISVAVCQMISRVRLARINAELVERMAERGFSPTEICDITIACNKGKPLKGMVCDMPVRTPVPPQKPIAPPV